MSDDEGMGSEIPESAFMRWMDHAMAVYSSMMNSVGITDPIMQVEVDKPIEILHGYMMLHGIDRADGEVHNYAEEYRDLMSKAKLFPGLPEVRAMTCRIELARSNLESAVLSLETGAATERGYRIERDDYNKVVVVREHIAPE